MKTIVIAILCLLVAGSFSSLIAVDEQRKAYDKMVKEATREADDYVQEKQKEQKASATDAHAQKDAALENRVQAERQRIDAEMDTVRGRGFSTTFTQGMKDNQLQLLQNQLDGLASDPEAYFKGR